MKPSKLPYQPYSLCQHYYYGECHPDKRRLRILCAVLRSRLDVEVYRTATTYHKCKFFKKKS